jgi:DNA-binding NarL/FixJ family response regulator
MLPARPKTPKARREKRLIRTLIIDDSPVALESLRLFLGTDKGCQLAGSSQSGRQAVELAATLHPDLVLLDLQMPGMNGLEATRRIKRQADPPLVLIVTVFNDDGCRSAAIAAGADGFVCKSEVASVLLPLIHTLFSGRTRRPDWGTRTRGPARDRAQIGGEPPESQAWHPKPPPRHR